MHSCLFFVFFIGVSKNFDLEMNFLLKSFKPFEPFQNFKKTYRYKMIIRKRLIFYIPKRLS